MESNERYYRRRAVEERMAAQRAMTERRARGTPSLPRTSPSAPSPLPAFPSAARRPSQANLASIENSFNSRSRVEDWEQFFAEKSRRRFEKERDERRRNRTRLTLAAGVITLLVVTAVVGLAVLA